MRYEDYNQTFGAEEFEALCVDIAQYLNGNLRKILIEKNRTGILGEFLRMIKFPIILRERDEEYLYAYQYPINAKVIVFGTDGLKRKDLIGIITSLKLDKNKFEFVEYSEATNKNFDVLRESSKYSAVLLGPTPHSVVGKGDFSSIIARIEKEKEFYPYFIRLADKTGNLKISKTCFREALQKLIDSKVLIQH